MVCFCLLSGLPAVAQFIDSPVGLPGVTGGTAIWGDYDGDGDLDVFLGGSTNGFNSGALSRIYRNDHGQFIDSAADLPSLTRCTAAWGDYDRDGDLDLLFTGFFPNITNNITRVFRNDNGTFGDIDVMLPAGAAGSVVWGDFDNDGQLDILITGQLRDSGSMTRIYWNQRGIFTNFATLLPGTYLGSVSVGDYDSDGWMDILTSGFWVAVSTATRTMGRL